MLLSGRSHHGQEDRRHRQHSGNRGRHKAAAVAELYYVHRNSDAVASAAIGRAGDEQPSWHRLQEAARH